MEYFTGSFSRLKTGATPPPPVTGLVPDIEASRLSGVAPLSVHFSAIGTTSDTTSNPYRDVLFQWNYGDADAATKVWSRGARPGTMSKNTETGHVSAHVFDLPGDYTVTLTCRDGVSVATKTVAIRVDDPAVVYSGTNTICVSSTGLPVAGVGGVPAGAQCFQLSTVEAATAKLTSNNQRLLFKCGDTFTISTTNALPAKTGLTVSSYGSGAKPLINFIGATNNYGCFSIYGADNRVMNLSFNTTIPGILDNTITGTLRSVSVATMVDHSLIYNTDGENVSTIAFLWGHYAMIVDCTLLNGKGGNHNVGVWYDVSGDGGAVMGSSIDNTVNIGHSIRTQCANKNIIAHNYLNGAGVEGRRLLAIRGHLYPEITEYTLISDNQFGSETERGGSVQVMAQTTGFDERHRNVIIEKNLFSGSAAYPSKLLLDPGTGFVMRNNITLHAASDSAGQMFIDLSHVNTAGSTTPSDCWVVNNSMYSNFVGNLSFYASWEQALPSPHDIHVVNNLVYAPNSLLDAFGNGQAAVTTLVNVPPLVESNNTTDVQLKTTNPQWISGLPTNVNGFLLSGSSYAKDAGTVLDCVREDFFGTLRTGTMDIGAVVG